MAIPNTDSYDHIERATGLLFKAGDRVQHKLTKETGTVRRPRSDQHLYLHVILDRNGSERSWIPRETKKIEA